MTYAAKITGFLTPSQNDPGLDAYEHNHGLPTAQWVNGKAAEIQAMYQHRYSGQTVWCSAHTGLLFKEEGSDELWIIHVTQPHCFSALCLEGEREGLLAVIKNDDIKDAGLYYV